MTTGTGRHAPRQEETFGPYVLQALLGRGGMGEVHRAFDTSRGRTVALKRLRSDVSRDPAYVQRFRRESQAAARLSSPHVIPIHDFGEIGGQLFIDMRLAEGSDLAEELAAGAWSPDRAVEMVGQIASALDAAHRAGIVHRDVKPSNVLVCSGSARDFAYLLDFGIVSALDDAGTRLTTTGAMPGTPVYMAPEAFTGGPVDHRVDIYALGCVLHELIGGRPPFAHGSLPALIHHHLSVAPPALGAPGTALGRLDEVIGRAMAKDPSDRFESAGALATAARAALDGTGMRRPQRLIDTAQGAPARATRPASVPPAPEVRSVAAGSFEHAVWGPTGAYLVATTPGGAAVLDPAGRIVAALDDRRASTHLAIDGPGTTIAIGTDEGARGSVILWDLDTRTHQDSAVRHDGALTGLAYTRDGLLATSSTDHTAALWDLESGRRLLRARHRYPVRAVAVHPSGHWLATGEHGVRLFDALVGGRWVRPLRLLPHAGIVCCLAFDPTGETLAGGDDLGQVALWDVVSGDRVAVLAHDDEVLALAWSPDGSRLVTGAGNGVLTEWDVSTSSAVRRIRLGGGVQSVAVWPGRAQVLAVVDDGGLQSIDLR